MFYNKQNNNAPRYLRDLIPPTIQSTTVYPLRNGSDIITHFYSLVNNKEPRVIDLYPKKADTTLIVLIKYL
jgi:hypothetical protein